MATDFVYLKGKAKWVRVERPDEWGNWSIQLHPDARGVEKLTQLKDQGLKNNLKKDEDGYYMAFRRPTQKLIKGKVVGFTPVKVVDTKGTPITSPVGNGSDVIVVLEVYQHSTPGGGKAKAARLHSIQVENLVPFEKKDYDEDRTEQVESLGKQAPPLF